MQQNIKRLRVVIIGGGIHGSGMLHDLTSRGWKDVVLLEKDRIGIGTSSRSTKLVHGGLRYLQRISQFGMVRESLKERKVLMELVPDIIHPLELVFPILKKGGRNRFVVQAGLTLYDMLAGKYHLNYHSSLKPDAALQKIPGLDTDKISHAFSFFDGQMDDLELNRRVAASGRQLGGEVFEGTMVRNLRADDDGWVVEYTNRDGNVQKIHALIVINAAGPWAHEILNASGILPTHQAINNKGSHLIFPDIGLKAGLFLETKSDGRIFFLIPWQNHTLLGTTEQIFSDDPGKVAISEQEIDYLLHNCNCYLKTPLLKSQILQTFSGLRWLAIDPGQTISSTSREDALGYHYSGRGQLITIYGGKYTSYRSLCENLGDSITKSFGEFRPSQTSDKKMWIDPHLIAKAPNVIERFTFQNWDYI